MIINKNLVKAAGYNPTKESRQKSIFEMCDLIEKVKYHYHCTKEI